MTDHRDVLRTAPAPTRPAADEASPANSAAPPSGSKRFVDRVYVTSGGGGALYRAWDLQLQTAVALKLMHRDAPHAGTSLTERAIETQVKHPSVVPLLSRWEDDQGIWLAMAWVDGGGTFLDVIEALTGASDPVTTAPSPERDRSTAESKPPITGIRDRPELDWVDLPSALHLLAEAALGVGAAHRAGFVHLDLKPDNIMFEMDDVDRGSAPRREWRFWHAPRKSGEEIEPPRRLPRPRVIDWGISARADTPMRDADGAAGAPPYMAPERIAGRASSTGRAADIYALGAVLYHLLAGKAPPALDRRQAQALLDAVLRPPGPRPPVHDRLRGYETSAYADVCQRAMQPDPTRRYPDALAFAHDLRRAQSRVMHGRATALADRSAELRAKARSRRVEADATLRALDEDDYSNLEARHGPWNALKQAAEDETEAAIREAQRVRLLRSILAVDPDYRAVAGELLEWGCARVRALDRSAEPRHAQPALEALRADVAHFREHIQPADDSPPPELLRAQALLKGLGTVSMRVAPDVRISLTPQIERHRRWLVDGTYDPIGRGTISAHPITAGRWVARLEAPGHHSALIPLRVHRGAHWPATHAGPESTPPSIPLPPSGTLQPDEVYIAPGPAWIGGDPQSMDSPQPGRSVWIDGFIVRRDPVSHGDWRAYLHDLVDRGRVDEALSHRPRAHPDQVLSNPTYTLDGERFRLTLGETEAEHTAAWPVCAISWDDAMAYAAWFDATRSAGHAPLGWRLISEWEFEKVARLGDERRLHWGDHAEPRFTRIAGSTEEVYLPTALDTPTLDVTPHGVRWIAGHALTWCLEGWAWDGPVDRLDVRAAIASTAEQARYRMLRGGAYNTPAGAVSGAARYAHPPDLRLLGAGLRLVRSWPPLAESPTPGARPADAIEESDVDPDQ